MPNHIIQQGECLASIAKRYNLSDYKAIYDHPDNAHLKRKRANPNHVYPGDVVFVPDLARKTHDCGSDSRHTFTKKNQNVKLRLVLKDSDGRPYADKRCTLTIGDKVLKSSTNGKGLVEYLVAADATQGKLTVWLDESDAKALNIHLLIGHLDPIDRVEGVQARLNNLGFCCGDVDGVLGDDTLGALNAFQKSIGLTTRELDDETCQKLLRAHDHAN